MTKQNESGFKRSVCAGMSAQKDDIENCSTQCPTKRYCEQALLDASRLCSNVGKMLEQAMIC